MHISLWVKLLLTQRTYSGNGQNRLRLQSMHACTKAIDMPDEHKLPKKKSTTIRQHIGYIGQNATGCSRDTLCLQQRHCIPSPQKPSSTPCVPLPQHKQQPHTWRLTSATVQQHKQLCDMTADCSW